MIKQKDVIFLRERIDFLKKNTGFTLIELIVTIAVSAILLSVSVAGIVAWVHHSDFVRNENYAETIYYAAQAELTRYRGNGQLAELEMLVKNAGAGDADIMGKVPVNKITDDYKASLTGAGDVDKYNEHYKDRLYYLKKDEGPAEENNPLGGLLSDYIYDGSIMDGAVCVEFDPSDGTVYSVTYSDKNEKFTYGEATEEKEFSLQDRTRNIRKKNRVGYYSTELSDAAPTAAGKTRVAEVQLINEEQLYLRWSLPGQFDGIRKFLSYTIEIYEKDKTDKTEDRLAYTFTLKGRDLKETDADLNIKDESGQIASGYVIEVTGERNSNDGTENPDTSEDFSGQFIAYSVGSEMYLVLDSIDYGAGKIVDSSVTEGGFNTAALKNSASILQLFPEPEDIYIRIQAQGKPYKTSAWKQSNASNTLFAAMKEENGFLGFGAKKDVYEIKNARHLYNVRYRERENSLPVTEPQEKITCYRQTADVVWPVNENRMFHSTYVDAGIETEMKMAALKDSDKYPLSVSGEKTPYFPAIPALETRSVLEAESGRNYELRDFVLYQGEGEETLGETPGETPGETLPKKRLGLIEVNKGTVQGLTFVGVKVQGIENVGAVCGINAAAGKILDTAVAGTVSGKENIGGLVGLDKAASGGAYDPNTDPTEAKLTEDSAYINLTNYAEVTASDGKAGGIVGVLNEKGQAYRCENYGAVKGTKTGTVYIGGIAGYNKGLVQSCVSAPDDTPPGNKGDGELEKAALKGIFVGGIVGCNNGGTIRDSSTAKETKDMSGTGGDAYVIGYRYVGGIVGYNNSAVEGGENTGTAGTLVNHQNSNKAKVIGHDYVGGIVGANGLLENGDIIKDSIEDDKSEYEDCEIKKSYSSKMIVEDWVNEGIVEAVGSVDSKGDYDSDGHYAGGIAGYNAGDLKNCTTRINTSSGGASDLIDQVRLYGKNASYVGGVAGYNVGRIYREDGTTSVNSVVSGKKYVGGIVGYNGTAEIADHESVPENSGKIENYELSGGNIFAESYAGGYVGLNTTKNLLSGTDGKPYMLTAKPNEVTADYMAGGVMGALILAPEKDEDIKDITVNCATDNFFGSVEATYAFAGGYAGYTQILRSEADAEDRAEKLHEKLTGAAGGAAGQQEKLQKLAEAVLDERLTMVDGNAELQFKYNGAAGENQFASIEAKIFAGGVIGCNSWNTKLLLENIHNKVKVTATASVPYGFISTAENTKDGSEKQDTFSFAGGIIGLVTPKAKIVSCGNSGAGDVEGVGTYGGGIAEVNLGTIESCEAATVSNKNYYGGIAGLNTNEGKILSCELTGQISGGSYLGGIAACNESVITGCTVKTKSADESAVIGTGQYVGGIAAVNRTKMKEGTEGESYLNQIKDCAVDANIGVSSMGERVGGLLGSYQGGSLENVEVKNGRNIYGVDFVGGIAGEIHADLKGTETEKIVNAAGVNAMREAGGIGGLLADGVSVEWCENGGMVRSMSGLAGGIVPQVTAASTVKDCRNMGSVEAVTSIAGGVAAENYGRIESCGAGSGFGETAETTSTEITIKGAEATGGIAGENMGVIAACEIKGHVAVNDINTRGGSRAIGGIAGKNQGEITNAKADGAADKTGKTWRPRISTLSQGSYLGGVAGTNVPDGTGRAGSGNITGGNLKLDVVLTSDQQGTSNRQGTVGGAAGANAGTITNVTFSGTVTGTSGSQYGTGGIAGRNELAEAGMTGTISSCRLDGGAVSAVSVNTGFGGHTDAVKGTYVGGICGVNPENGTISGCSLRGGSSVSGNYGYVGGIAAYNLGTLINNKSTQAQNATIFNSGNNGAGRCVMGGIAAYNGASGKLENCETGGWTISNDMNAEVEVYPTGGIIGCNKSIYDQKGLVNYAEVYGNWMTGGVIGQQITEQRSGFTIERCENHGNVTAKYRSAGGIISDWRNQSGKVRECINYGEVSIEYGDGYERNVAGGIIGTGWWGTPVEITIERCGNEGRIFHDTEDSTKRGKAAGIFGAYNAASDGGELDLSITDCYNAAEIQNENPASGEEYVSAGIFAGDERGGTINAKIIRCVNYGKGTRRNMKFGGLVSARYSKSFTIEDCLCAGEGEGYNMWPAHSGINEGPNNYFIKNPSGVVSSNPSSKTVAEHQGNDTFRASGGASFDTTNMRLILPADPGDTRGRYLQFSAVGSNAKYNDSTTGDAKQEEIIKLKNAFSAYEYRKSKGVDDKYALLVYGITKGTFNPPGNVELKEEDGVYTVTFEPDADTLFCTTGYEVEIVGERRDNHNEEIIKSGTGMEINDPSKNSFTIAESNLFDQTHLRTDYIRLKARVRAKKVDSTDYKDIIAPVKNEKGEYSEWEESPWLSSKPKLPTPVFHFEVTAEGNDKNDNVVSGYWVLDNAEAYNKLCGENWEVVLTGKDDIGVLDSSHIRAGSRTSGGEWRYSSDKGQGSAADERVQAEAKPTGEAADSYEPSKQVNRMLNLYRKSSTLRADAVGSGEFIGTTADDLRYHFSLKQSGGNYAYVNITYMAEFWLGNEKLGESAVALPMQSKEADCTIALEKKADETEEAYQKKIRRLINSVNQNNSADVKVCFYPWEIEDVKYYVTDDTTKEIVSRTVPDAANASAGVAGNTGVFNSSYQTIYVNNLTNYKMYPAPEPGATLNPDITADGVISYTLYWDMIENADGTLTERTGTDTPTGTSYAGAEYAVTVTGKNGDTEVVLYQGSGDTEGGKTRNKVTLQENNWKYRQLILTVERLGKEGTPHCIGASVTWDYPIPIRLNSVQGLTAKLRDRDSLVIDVEWIPSPETGVDGYEITVKGKNAIGKDVSITIPVPGKDTGNVQIDLDEKDVGGTEIYKDLKGIDVLGFSIAAVPKSGDADYMRSRESDVYSVTIPARLDPPGKDPELMRGDKPVTADGLPPEAFTEFLLQLEDAAAPSEDAAYEVEYFIADKDAETNGPLKDWDHTAGNRPKDDVEGIYISAAVKMDGNLQSAKYMLNQDGFDAEQAGRKIWYRVRAVSNNKISSVWTVWVGKELPKALLEPVEIPEDQTSDGKYAYTIEKPDGTAGDSYELSIRQPKAGFVPVEFAKGYEIYIQGAKRTELVYNPDKDEEELQEVTPNPLSYRLEEAEPAQDGTKPLRPFKLTDKDGTVLDDGIKAAEEIKDAAGTKNILQVKTSGGEATYIYTLYTVTHSYEVVTSEGTFIYSIPIDAKLCYRTKDNAVQEIWLEMPEGVALTTSDEEISERQFIATSLVDVTVIAPDEDRYVVDELTRWQRVKNDKDEYTDIKISKEDVKTAPGSRIAVAGYYEDMLNLDEMSDRQLKLFRLKREDFQEEEEIDKSDVSENNVMAEDDKTSEDDEASGNDTTSGNETEKKDPEESEDSKDKEQGSGGSSGSGTEEKPPAKPESGKDETQGSDETSEGGVSGDSAEEKKSKEEKSGEQESGGEETSGNNMETDRAE